jgi:molybdenum cofactor cytidylyltransferase
MARALGDAPAKLVHNRDYLQGEMLSSFQCGVRHLLSGQAGASERYLGTLLALGDQPHIPMDVIQSVIEQARQTPGRIVIPSFEMRRGHPFYLPFDLWSELLDLGANETLRTLLQRHQNLITYVNVTTDAILRDIDTPADYTTLSAASHPSPSHTSPSQS